MKEKSGKIAQVISYKEVPSSIEAKRENIRWFKHLSPIQKIRLLHKQKLFLKKLGVIK